MKLFGCRIVDVDVDVDNWENITNSQNSVRKKVLENQLQKQAVAKNKIW
jgi:hypothetical protein